MTMMAMPVLLALSATTITAPSEAGRLANLLGVVAVAGELHGLDLLRSVAASLTAYRGLRRRFEVLWQGRTVLVDDYAHHPTEISATISAARERFPRARRTIAVFQPHQQQRLDSLGESFLASLVGADRVFVTPVFSARETGKENAAASAKFTDQLVEAGASASFCTDFETARRDLLACIEPKDVVLFLGAGDITTFAGEVASAVARKESSNG